MKKKLIATISMICIATSLTACNTNPKYTKYKKEVDNLYTTIAETDAILNNINAESPQAKDILFEQLDKLETTMTDFSKISAPKEFKDCEYLAGQSAELITEAKTDFHMALDDKYNSSYFNTAVYNYDQAVKCINYMGMVLQQKKVNSESAESVENVEEITE